MFGIEGSIVRAPLNRTTRAAPRVRDGARLHSGQHNSGKNFGATSPATFSTALFTGYRQQYQALAPRRG
jgi:hypothetical protein